MYILGVAECVYTCRKNPQNILCVGVYISYYVEYKGWGKYEAYWSGGMWDGAGVVGNLLGISYY